jgi:photosystem II stability/assembly factor-like uncharacterized protein
LRSKQVFSPITLPSPVLSLTGDGRGGVWAGGIGGVAHFAPAEGWTPLISGLPVSGVSGLAAAKSWLFAGGVEGLARSANGGVMWQQSKIEGKGSSIAAIAPSPSFEQDKSALAGTLEGGILRTEDAGHTWHGSNFGLQNFEVTALAWLDSDHVLAGTANGIFRSPNGGRAWRAIDETVAESIAAVVALPDGSVLAVLDDGKLLHGSAGGVEWDIRSGDLPADIVPTALCSSGGVLLLGTANSGLLRSPDGGRTWAHIADFGVFSLTTSGDMLYAGTGTGLSVSPDAGATWEELPPTPLHDLRRINIVQSQVLVTGRYSVALRYNPAGFWEALTTAPLPLTLMVVDAQGRLFASGPDGLFLSDDAGDHWHQVLGSEGGHLGLLSFGQEGLGWAASADSTRLLRTGDGGLNWELAPSPLGVDPLAALEAAPGLVFAATYSPLQQIARLWYSTDGGDKWYRGAEARTGWPVVATYPQPPMMSLGDTIFAQQPDTTWQTARMPDDAGQAVRRIVGGDGFILALTTGGILVSVDNAASFEWLNGIDLPTDQIMDVALDGMWLYILLVGGQVYAFELPLLIGNVS